MEDPGAAGRFLTTNVTTSTSTGGNGERFAEFTFGNEVIAPNSIVAYASDMINNQYKITAFNSGGTNKNFLASNATMTVKSGNNYESDLFTTFSNLTIKLDLTQGNLDYSRIGFPAKEAHAYILFAF